ncbi:MAG: protein kinase [Planctomycetales bacterium]|nr:protein kinase [Planctomycetales bacterium]
MPRSGPETVVNPEKRAAAGSSIDHALVPSAPKSSIARVLFPAVEADEKSGQDLSGLTIGHFQVTGRIRSGGMGAVFKALDTRLNRTVALKVLPPSLARDETSVLRFRNEAQAAAQLDHENIARVFYIGEDEGLHYIAFEFVTGTNLRELIQQHGRMPIADAVNFTLQTASALLHMASKGVVHRDIKPSNIIITPTGRAKLVDMGLARQEKRVAANADLTLAGTTLGTFDYISPEQARDPRTADVRSDIYSLGCTLYHMLTGEPPYPEGTVLQKLLQHQGEDPPNPTLKNRQVPENLAAVVREMMAKDPRRRYQTAEQLVRDLMLVAGSLGLRSLSPEGLVWLSSSPRSSFWERHLAWMATVACLLIIVGYLEFGATRWNPLSNLDRQNDLASNGDAMRTAESRPRYNGEGSVAVTKRPGTNSNERVMPKENEPSGASPTATAKSPSDEASRPPTSLTSDTEIRATAVAKAKPATGSTGSAAETSRRPDTSKAGVAAGAEVSEPAIVILSPDGSTSQSYPTLEAACSAAADGSVIELRFQGRRQEAPVRVTKRVTIRAARGLRPVVEFVPKEIPAEGLLTRMITVVSGQLEMIGFDILLNIPDGLSGDQWTVVAAQRPEAVRLDGMSITLNNPRQRPCAVVELAPGWGASMPDIMSATKSTVRTPLEVEVTSSLIRGGGDLFLVKHVIPLRLSVKESAVALDGTLLREAGSQALPTDSTHIELRIDHITGLMSRGLVRLDGGEAGRRLLPLQVSSSNSIFSTNHPEPLVTASGMVPAQDLRQLLRWNGQRNFYDRFDSLWMILSTDGAGRMENLNFSMWQNHWGTALEVEPRDDGVLWQEDWATKPLAEMRADDFALDRDVLDNPAVSGATDGRDAGADVARLPR